MFFARCKISQFSALALCLVIGREQEGHNNSLLL
jgi:hypothetical protein